MRTAWGLLLVAGLVLIFGGLLSVFTAVNAMLWPNLPTAERGLLIGADCVVIGFVCVLTFRFLSEE